MFERPEESSKDKKKKKKSGGKLHIKLKEARNLPAKDANGFSDPFCKRYFYVKYNNEHVQTSLRQVLDQWRSLIKEVSQRIGSRSGKVKDKSTCKHYF